MARHDDPLHPPAAGHVQADADEGAEVVAAGVIRISVPAFLRQLTTFRAAGRSGTASVVALSRFGVMFLGGLWDVYGRRVLAASPSEGSPGADVAHLSKRRRRPPSAAVAWLRRRTRSLGLVAGASVALLLAGELARVWRLGSLPVAGRWPAWPRRHALATGCCTPRGRWRGSSRRATG